MSGGSGPHINGSFSGNVNSINILIAEDGADGYWRRTIRDIIEGHAEEGSTRAEQNKRTEGHVQTQPGGSNPVQASRPVVNNIPGNFPSFPGGALLGEPGGSASEPAPEGTVAYGDPARELPSWKLDYIIGSGTLGTIFLEKVQTREMESPELWAVKRIPRTLPNFPSKRFQNEIKNFQALSNYEWFVKFIASYEDAHCLYIAMEYIPIGDMSKTFKNGYRWKEGDAKVVIEQLLHGLAVMHKEGIIHRDLKPENVFLRLPVDEAPILQVKIGDFGTSKRIALFNPGTCLMTTAGTLGYMAPEVDDTLVPKTNSVDVWSLGCILYRMVAGSPLFNSRWELYKYAITASSPPLAIKNKGFSLPCQDFLRNVLQPSPENRPSAEGCLNTAWIINKAPGSAHSIGRGLYTRLSKVQLRAPNIDSLSDMIANLAADNAPSRSPSSGDISDWGEIFRDWMFNYKIGVGTFGTIFLEKVQARGMEYPELWAVKRMPRNLSNFPSKQFQYEIKNLQALSNSEWFVKLITSYKDDNYLYIAMEYIAIRDLSNTFANGYRWNESDTRVVIEQLLHGLAVMHKEGITHRDLKPENVFLCLPEDGTRILRVKIGDFGSSKRITPSDSSTCLRTTVGTLHYMAPEIDDTMVPKTNRVDIWSLGCILYRMFAGSPLFPTRFSTFKYIMTGSSLPPEVEKAGFSVSCVNFLRDVLQPEPGDRPSAEDCLKKAWIMNKNSGPEYSIGWDLYSTLFKIKLAAPNVDTFSEMVADRVAENASASSSIMGTGASVRSESGTTWSTGTFGSTGTLGPY